jgi:hypothetical protein
MAQRREYLFSFNQRWGNQQAGFVHQSHVRIIQSTKQRVQIRNVKKKLERCKAKLQLLLRRRLRS